MNKTKIIAIILAAILCCGAVAGCKAENKNNGLSEGAVTAPVTPEEMQELIDQGVISDTTEAGEADGTTDGEAAPYTKGVVENNVYKNEACDITLRIPTGWNVQDDYNLCSLMGITYDFEDSSKNLEAISKQADIYDLVTSDKTGDQTIMVLMQDLNQHGLGGTTAADYLDVMKLQFVSENATFDVGEISEISYSGNSYSMMKVITTPNEGTEVTQYFYVREANGRMITVMITFPSADPINPDTIFA